MSETPAEQQRRAQNSVSLKVCSRIPLEKSASHLVEAPSLIPRLILTRGDPHLWWEGLFPPGIGPAQPRPPSEWRVIRPVLR